MIHHFGLPWPRPRVGPRRVTTTGVRNFPRRSPPDSVNVAQVHRGQERRDRDLPGSRGATEREEQVSSPREVSSTPSPVPHTCGRNPRERYCRPLWPDICLWPVTSSGPSPTRPVRVFHVPRRVFDGRKGNPSALLILQLRSARSVVCVLPIITTSYALAAFSAETQPARSPLLIARAIISGKASGVQANDGIPMAARLPATSWL